MSQPQSPDVCTRCGGAVGLLYHEVRLDSAPAIVVRFFSCKYCRTAKPDLWSGGRRGRRLIKWTGAWVRTVADPGEAEVLDRIEAGRPWNRGRE